MRSDPHRAAWTAAVEGKAPPANRSHALGRLKSGERNKTEAAYEQHLELRKQVGEVLWYGFEIVTFKLANDVRLTPDFMVMLADGTLEAHDTKGTTSRTRKSGQRDKVAYCLDDARIKLEVAAQMIPIVFKTVHYADGNWVEKEF